MSVVELYGKEASKFERRRNTGWQYVEGYQSFWPGVVDTTTGRHRLTVYAQAGSAVQVDM